MVLSGNLRHTHENTISNSDALCRSAPRWCAVNVSIICVSVSTWMKFKVMSSLWLPREMRKPASCRICGFPRPMWQPAQASYADRAESTWHELVEECQFGMFVSRMVAGAPMLALQWDCCLENECQVRKECYGIQAAQWCTYENSHNRMEHWVTLLSWANKVLVRGMREQGDGRNAQRHPGPPKCCPEDRQWIPKGHSRGSQIALGATYDDCGCMEASASEVVVADPRSTALHNNKPQPD